MVTSVGVAILFRLTRRQRDDHLQVLHDLEIARVQGHRWRSESRSLLNGLGTAINEQFSPWNLTDAEREVSLLLLKGLSTKEIAAVRAGRAHGARARALDRFQGRIHRPLRIVGIFFGGFACSDRGLGIAATNRMQVEEN